MGLAEWMLKRAVGEARGTAIYGDLVELAATHGRMWFWVEYARMLISLTWRAPAAVVAGAVVSLAAGRPWIFLPGKWWWETFRSHPYFFDSVGYVVFSLWFLVPFVAVMYGMRDRLAKLACIACVMVSIAYLAMPVFPLFLFMLSLALLVFAGTLFSTEWRGTGVALGCTTAASVFVQLTIFKLVHLGAWYYMKGHLGPHFSFWEDGFALPRHLFWIVIWTMFAMNALAITLLSTRFHRRFVGASQ